MQAIARSRAIAQRKHALLLARARAQARRRPPMRLPPHMGTPRVVARSGGPIVQLPHATGALGTVQSVVQNRIVGLGLDAIGSAFGDPALGEQVGQIAGLALPVVQAVAHIFDGDTHSAAELEQMTGAYAGVSVTPNVVKQLVTAQLPPPDDGGDFITRRNAL